MQTLASSKWGEPIRAISKPAPPVNSRTVTASSAETLSVKIYNTIKVTERNTYLVPSTHFIRRDVDPKEAALNKLFYLSRQSGEAALIPQGTRVLGIHVDRGIATLDLSHEFVDNFHGGSLQESLTLESIVRTLGQFRDVDRVRILVEGRAVDTLGGHFGLAEPLYYKSGIQTGGTE